MELISNLHHFVVPSYHQATAKVLQAVATAKNKQHIIIMTKRRLRTEEEKYEGEGVVGVDIDDIPENKIPIFVFDDDEVDENDEDLTVKAPPSSTAAAAAAEPEGMKQLNCGGLKRRQKQKEQEVLDAYKKYQAVLIRRGRRCRRSEAEQGKSFSWKDIQSLYRNLNEKDQESFCIESSSSASASASASASTTRKQPNPTPLDFLRPEILDEHEDEDDEEEAVASASTAAAYCSFLVQHDESSLQKLLEQVPVKEILPTTDITADEEEEEEGKINDYDESTSSKTNTNEVVMMKEKNQTKGMEIEKDSGRSLLGIDHEPCVWIFFGRNYDTITNISDADDADDRDNHANNDSKTDNEDRDKKDGNSANKNMSDSTDEKNDLSRRRKRRRRRRGDLLGRPEHTDSISHDGTWHYQLSGTKRWYIRPTTKLLEHFDQHQPHKRDDTTQQQNKKSRSTTLTKDKKFENGEEGGNNMNSKTGTESIQVDCCEGDVFIINTRLWYHQTILPPQPNPSVSYARDFWLKPKRETRKMNNNEADQTTATPTAESPNGGTSTEVIFGDDDPTKGITMTNVDGLYATEDIEEGTVIFREDTMPDIELHRSATNSNCYVVEVVDEDGVEIQAVVSTRPIAAGEFFCMPESDDEGEEEEEEGEFEDVDEE